VLRKVNFGGKDKLEDPSIRRAEHMLKYFDIVLRIYELETGEPVTHDKYQHYIKSWGSSGRFLGLRRKS